VQNTDVFTIFVVLMSKLLRPYLFAALVFSYFLTVVGLPVYMHYCGGQVEEISYVVNSNGCCGDEVPADNDCCHDEGLVLSCKVDFTIKDFSPVINTTVTDLFYLLPGHKALAESDGHPSFSEQVSALPPFQNSLLAEIVVLKI
jgi:hypothetical protein